MNPRLKKKLRRKVIGAALRSWWFAALKKKEPSPKTRIMVIKIIHSIRY